jgi:uncharacterized protein (DUF2236 family)
MLTMHTIDTDKPRYIDKAQLREQLEDVRGVVVEPLEGLFGPRSMFWEVMRYSTTFIGAGRALLLQTAHPWVASAVAQHSQMVVDPLGRFHRTFRSVFSMVFGSLEQALAASIHVHNIHATVFGRLDEQAGIFGTDSYYQANEVHALIWVYATLVETAMQTYELIVRPLTDAEKEHYYRDSKLFAHCFGIPASALPPTWTSFVEYNEWMWKSDRLFVGQPAMDIARLAFDMSLPLRPAANYYKTITSMLLPPRIRELYDLPPATAHNVELGARFIRNVKLIFPHLPRALRFMPPYQEACRRIEGKHAPDLLTGAFNWLTVGQRVLVSS